MKKKKKKKKTPFDLEGALNEGGEEASEAPKDDDAAVEDIDLDTFGKKKKKKKKVTIDDEEEKEDEMKEEGIYANHIFYSCVREFTNKLSL